MTKKSFLKFVRIAVTTALLVFVIHKADLLTAQGWQNLLDTFSQANLWLVLLSVLLVPLVDFVSSVKWYFLARACGLKVGLWRLYAYYVVGRFFNLILPSSIGGDVIRVNELGRYTGRYADSAAVVFVERFTGLAMLVFLATMAVIVNLQKFNLPWLTAALVIGLVGIAFICWIILDERPYNFVKKHLGDRIKLISVVLNKLGKFRKAVLIYQAKPGALWLAVFNSLVFYALAICNVWVSVLAFDGEVSFWNMIVAVPIIMFIMNIPFSIGGLGITEYAYSFVLGLFGINTAVALATILLMRLKTLLAAGIGGLIYPLVSDSMASPEELTQAATQSYPEPRPEAYSSEPYSEKTNPSPEP
ncbi:MAG: lysylphosphatidylglycerol synthase transmembrane domain-containing protein [Cyanobacteria bacterium J06632_3]